MAVRFRQFTVADFKLSLQSLQFLVHFAAQLFVRMRVKSDRPE
jgi:hypothetical protein